VRHTKVLSQSARSYACEEGITTQIKRAAGVPMRRTMICGVVRSGYIGGKRRKKKLVPYLQERGSGYSREILSECIHEK